MKKLLFGIVFLLFMTSCHSNGDSEKAKEDSARIADSIALIEAAVEQARQDSIRQDSIAKAEKAQEAAQYDDLLNRYIKSVNNLNYINANKSWVLGNQLEKVKDKLTPEQLEKYEKAKAKRQRNYAD